MKIKKNYFWILGVILAFILYLIWYIYVNILSSKTPNLGIIALGYILVIPCHAFRLNNLDNPSLCLTISLLGYMILGALIGLLISKIKR